MRPLSIPKGSVVLFGAPAKPMPGILSNAIGIMVQGILGIREAYLPQCYVKETMEVPAQILVVVLDTTVNPQNVLDSIGQGLARVLPPGIHLDVWPMGENDSLLSTVRETGTNIHDLTGA